MLSWLSLCEMVLLKIHILRETSEFFTDSHRNWQLFMGFSEIDSKSIYTGSYQNSNNGVCQHNMSIINKV